MAKTSKILDDVVTITLNPCRTHKIDDKSYLVWQAYARERNKKGDKQTQCNDCGRWFYEDEF